MSLFNQATVTCPHCAAQFDVAVVASINADRRPDLRQAILDGTFQAQTCDACGTVFRLPPNVSYVDVERGQWIMAYPADELENWAVLETHATEIFDAAYGPAAPAAAREIGAGLDAPHHVRLARAAGEAAVRGVGSGGCDAGTAKGRNHADRAKSALRQQHGVAVAGDGARRVEPRLAEQWDGGDAGEPGGSARRLQRHCGRRRRLGGDARTPGWPQFRRSEPFAGRGCARPLTRAAARKTMRRRNRAFVTNVCRRDVLHSGDENSTDHDGHAGYRVPARRRHPHGRLPHVT